MVVTTGYPGPGSKQTELFDLQSEDAVCTAPSGITTWPHLSAYGAGGFLGDDTLAICGGDDALSTNRQTCSLVNVKDGSATYFNLNQARNWAHILPLGNGTLWLTGGFDPDVESTELSSTLYLTKVLNFDHYFDNDFEQYFIQDGLTPGPDMPAGEDSHCLAWIDARRAMLTGGYNNKKKSHIYDFDSGLWTPGPDFTQDMEAHACGRLWDLVTGEAIIVAAAGLGGPATELWMPGSSK